MKGHPYSDNCFCDVCTDTFNQRLFNQVGLQTEEGRTKMKKVVKKRILKNATSITKKSLTTGTKKVAR